MGSRYFSLAYIIIISLFVMSQKQIVLGVLVGAVAYMWWKSTTTPNNPGSGGNGNGPTIDPANPDTVSNSQPDYQVSVAGCVYKPASTILTI